MSENENHVAGLWKTPMIHVNGDVTTCCLDEHLENRVGNINDTPLSQIWNSQQLKDGEKHIWKEDLKSPVHFVVVAIGEVQECCLMKKPRCTKRTMLTKYFPSKPADNGQEKHVRNIVIYQNTKHFLQYFGERYDIFAKLSPERYHVIRYGKMIVTWLFWIFALLIEAIHW